MQADTALSASRSPRLQPQTPPASTSLQSSSFVSVANRLEQVLDKLVHVLEKTNNPDKAEAAKPEAVKDAKADKPKARASKLEYKLVEEVWDRTASKYNVVESTPLPEEITELDEYVFVVRARKDRLSFEQTFYVDIKSEGLRDILRIVLQDKRGISLIEDKITIERNLLFHYLTELKVHRTELEDESDNAELKHLDLLVDYIRTTYASTTSRLALYLKNREITYNLLWALFEPNTAIYTTMFDAENLACFKYESGKERTNSNDVAYFHVECRYLDYNGKAFGEVSTALGIQMFQGAKRIDSLEAFPLEFHQHYKETRTHLLKCGRRFVSLMGEHHVQYLGNAAYLEQGEYIEVPVDSHIMVDVVQFRKVNPNYIRPRINELARSSSLDGGDFIFFSDMEPKENYGLDPQKMSDDELMICSQTVFGWSFGNKQWLELLVDNMTPIIWNPSSFENLTIPLAKKKVITALAKAYMSRESDDAFDDFIEGKGQGLITLLHGPPGVGKTLTAEGLSEYLKRPLYAISAGELGLEAKALEDQLSCIFRLAHHWKVIVLLDEADVFVQARSFNNPHNALVLVFLRKLEYYRGIMFLTTNCVKDFDDAIQSRISVALHYEPLGFNTRKTIWESFLKKVATVNGPAKYTPIDLDGLAKRELNGRQIKNLVTTARALAVSEGKPLSLRYLETVIALDKEFQKDYNGVGQFENSRSYT